MTLPYFLCSIEFITFFCYQESTEPVLADLRKAFKESQEKNEANETEAQELRSALETEQKHRKQVRGHTMIIPVVGAEVLIFA